MWSLQISYFKAIIAPNLTAVETSPDILLGELIALSQTFWLKFRGFTSKGKKKRKKKKETKGKEKEKEKRRERKEGEGTEKKTGEKGREGKGVKPPVQIPGFATGSGGGLIALMCALLVVLVISCDASPGKLFCLFESKPQTDDSLINVIVHVDLASIQNPRS